MSPGDEVDAGRVLVDVALSIVKAEATGDIARELGIQAITHVPGREDPRSLYAAFERELAYAGFEIRRVR